MNPGDLVEVPGTREENPLVFIEEALRGLRLYQTVSAALELGIFEAFQTPGATLSVAQDLGCNEHLLGLLCNTLVSQGLLVKVDDQYVDSDFSRKFFLRDAPFTQIHAMAFMNHTARTWMKLSAIVKEGPLEFEREQFFRDLVIPSMADAARCGMVQRTVAIVAELPEFYKAKRLLDLGGGHGLYAIAFGALNPDLEAVVFDLPQVTEKTLEYIQMYGVGNVGVMPGNFFTDPLGEGYDIIFSSSNPGGRDIALIPKIAAALNVGGLFINKQPAEDAGEDPLLNLDWNLWTFKGIQKRQRRYTFENSASLDEYSRHLERSCLKIVRTVEMADSSRMTIAQKMAG
jgi:hypothetical protein